MNYLLMLIGKRKLNLRRIAGMCCNTGRYAKFRTLRVVPLSASIFFCSNMMA